MTSKRYGFHPAFVFLTLALVAGLGVRLLVPGRWWAGLVGMLVAYLWGMWEFRRHGIGRRG